MATLHSSPTLVYESPCDSTACAYDAHHGNVVVLSAREVMRDNTVRLTRLPGTRTNSLPAATCLLQNVLQGGAIGCQVLALGDGSVVVLGNNRARERTTTWFHRISPDFQEQIDLPLPIETNDDVYYNCWRLNEREILLETPVSDKESIYFVHDSITFDLRKAVVLPRQRGSLAQMIASNFPPRSGMNTWLLMAYPPVEVVHVPDTPTRAEDEQEQFRTRCKFAPHVRHFPLVWATRLDPPALGRWDSRVILFDQAAAGSDIFVNVSSLYHDSVIERAKERPATIEFVTLSATDVYELTNVLPWKVPRSTANARSAVFWLCPEIALVVTHPRDNSPLLFHHVCVQPVSLRVVAGYGLVPWHFAQVARALAWLHHCRRAHRVEPTEGREVAAVGPSWESLPLEVLELVVEHAWTAFLLWRIGVVN